MKTRSFASAIPAAFARSLLKRPQALNSFTGAMHGELRAALDAAAADREVRCVRRHRHRPGAFAPARTLPIPRSRRAASRGRRRPTSARRSSASTSRSRCASARCRCRWSPPSTAWPRAPASTSPCRATSSSPRARRPSTAPAKIAVPDCGGTWLLPRLVGRANALALAMLGDKLGAEDAVRLGLIWKCVDDGALAAEVAALAARLAALPRRAPWSRRASRSMPRSSSISPARSASRPTCSATCCGRFPRRRGRVPCQARGGVRRSLRRRR